MRILTVFLLLVMACSPQRRSAVSPVDYREIVIQTLKEDILKEAAWAMEQEPITVTAQHSPRSAGGIHDFFSEGDYWWPDPRSADSPYIQKDGMTNPDNF